MKPLGFILLILLLAACSQAAEPENPPGATGKATAAQTTPDPTLPPTSLPTVMPAETAVPPTEEPTAVPAATPVQSGSETFATTNILTLNLFSEEPVIEREPGNKYLNGGAVIFHQGQFHMFSNFFNTWPGRTVTYYHTSPDGQSWTRESEEPLFTISDVPLDGSGALILSGLVLPDATWVLYYHTYSSSSSPGYIGRLSAPAPTGPWTFDETPALSPGGEGEWDELQVMRVNVLPTGAGYVMYYAGINQANESRIGMALSPDTITWEKYDDPQTTAAPYAESDPIMEPEMEWEGTWLNRPEVVETADGWVMLYEGGRSSQTGLAVSQDGLHFSRYQANPLLTRENMVKGYSFFQGAFFHQENTYYYLIEAGNGAVGTDIYLYQHTGSLLAE